MMSWANTDRRVACAVAASVAFHVGGIAYLSISARAQSTAPRPLAVRLVAAAPTRPSVESAAPVPVPRRVQPEPKRPVLQPVPPKPTVAPTVPFEPPQMEIARADVGKTVTAATPPTANDTPRTARDATVAIARESAERAATPVTTAPVFGADYLQNPPPVYPVASRRFGEQGTVLLRVFVNAAGAAESVLVKESSGFARLDESALEAVRRWRFVPARRGADPIAAWVVVPVSFRVGRT